MKQTKKEFAVLRYYLQTHLGKTFLEDYDHVLVPLFQDRSFALSGQCLESTVKKYVVPQRLWKKVTVLPCRLRLLHVHASGDVPAQVQCKNAEGRKKSNYGPLVCRHNLRPLKGIFGQAFLLASKIRNCHMSTFKLRPSLLPFSVL